MPVYRLTDAGAAPLILGGSALCISKHLRIGKAGLIRAHWSGDPAERAALKVSGKHRSLRNHASSVPHAEIYTIINIQIMSSSSNSCGLPVSLPGRRFGQIPLWNGCSSFSRIDYSCLQWWNQSNYLQHFHSQQRWKQKLSSDKAGITRKGIKWVIFKDEAAQLLLMKESISVTSLCFKKWCMLSC